MTVKLMIKRQGVLIECDIIAVSSGDSRADSWPLLTQVPRQHASAQIGDSIESTGTR